MARSVVTGGCGFVGSMLTRKLLERGDEVLIVDNFFSGSRSLLPEGPDVFLLEEDITQPVSLKEAIAEFAPDVVYHLAAIHFIPYCNAHWDEALQTNVIGVQNVLEASKVAKGVVFASTAAVYGISDVANKETDEPAPTDIYGLTKKMGEEVCGLWSKETGIPTRAGRLFNIYGPNETNPHLIPEILYQALHCPRIELGNMETKRDYIHVTDIVSGLMALPKTFDDGKTFDAYNIGTGREYSAQEIVEALVETLPSPVAAVSVPERTRKSDRKHLRADNSKLRALGWAPAVELAPGLRDLVVNPQSIRAPRP